MLDEVQSSGQVVVCMPAFNEGEGIAAFIAELDRFLRPTAIVVVNDCSEDDTSIEIDKISQEISAQLFKLENQVNLGHGPSLLRAIKFALARFDCLVLTIDGDGQFLGPDVMELLTIAMTRSCDVLEGVRIRRGDPWFRRIATALTRGLVFVRCRRLPRDANTPLRIYQNGTLQSMISYIPDNSLTPNLLMSVLARRARVQLCCVEIPSLPRRAQSPIGSTWRQKFTRVPSRRFLSFCSKSLVRFVFTHLPRGSEFAKPSC